MLRRWLRVLRRSEDNVTGPVVLLVVFNAEHHPVLIVEIKEDNCAGTGDTRFTADELMRQRFDEMIGKCPASRLWGLSLLGTSLRVYCCDVATGAITPTFVAHTNPDCIIPHNFLEGGWEMEGIVADIVTGVSAS